jgi:putative DNA methylase
MTAYRKKLIEVALPLASINQASSKEKEPFTRDHPRSLHIWWARRPLVACRAVLFASVEGGVKVQRASGQKRSTYPKERPVYSPRSSGCQSS